MGIVLCESLIGMICPLTEWENNLRVREGQDQVYETSFMKECIHKIMFFDFSELTFVIVYALFFALILLTFWVIPLDLRKSSGRPGIKSLCGLRRQNYSEPYLCGAPYEEAWPLRS
jgi:hypothetical protein